MSSNIETIRAEQKEGIPINGRLEKSHLDQFFRRTSYFPQKITEKFNPFLNKIEIKIHNHTYRCPQKQIEGKIEKFKFFADEKDNSLISPNKITIKRNCKTEKITSVSFSWPEKTNEENLFLKINFEENKLKNIERKVKPNTILRTKSAKKEFNKQIMKFEIDYTPLKIKMTFGYISGKHFYFIYPHVEKNHQPVFSKNIEIPRPKLEDVLNRIDKIEKEFLR